jgi:CheY-like chemotaxis protein
MNKHILVIDDDAQLRSVLQAALESEAYVVDIASDGLIALDKLMHRQEMPEVILLDLYMPRLNGFELIEAIRQREEVWLDSIIVFSADRDALKQARTLGIRRCLAKPFDLDTLLELISSSVV